MSWLHHTKRITARILFPYIWHYFTDDYKDRFHHLVIDTIGSLIILSLLGANIILGGWLYLFSITPTVTTSISVPEVIISGETLNISATITPDNKTIHDVSIKWVIPSSYSPSGSLEQHWNTVHKGEVQTSSLSGRFNGNVQQTYRVILLYSYHYYGQSFSGSIAREFKVDTSSLEVIASTPEQILNNETFTWTVDYLNSSEVDRTDVCIQLDLPDTFTIEHSSLPINNGQVVLQNVSAHTGGTIEITGSFSNAVGEGKHVLGVTGIDQCADVQFRQISLQQPIEVLTPRLQLTTTGPAIANVGDTLVYSLVYRNTGDTTLNHIVLTTHQTNDVTQQFIDEAELAPGEQRTKTFTIIVPASTRQKNLSVGYSASATANIADIGVQTYTPVVSYQTKFNSTLTLSQVARYTSTTGQQLGYGPYPLQAWEVTALRVFWQVEDFTNDLSDVTMTATLPSQVTWTGYSAVTEGGAMSYDATTRTVTWHTSSIPSFSHAQGASFEVRIMPNSDQVGKQINITNGLTFTAKDSYTGSILTRTLGALRTTDSILPEQL